MHLAVVVAQEAPPIEGFAQYGVLGLVVMALAWFAWQQVKQLRADLVEARQELKDSRARELAMAEKMGTETATLLAQAAQAIERVSRRRGQG